MRPRAAVAIALAVSIAFLAAGPSIGELRSWMRNAFPGWFGVVVNVILGVSVAAACVAAATRIRNHRALRFGLIAAAIAIAVASAVTMASAIASQNAVERFHFVQYGLVTWLWYRVGRGARGTTADLSTFVVPALIALVVGSADETVQWIVPERVGEYRDIFLNGTAILAGLSWSAGLDLPAPWSWRLAPPSRRRIAIAAAAALAAIAGFLHLAQLGGTVTDDGIDAAFVSRYTGDQLLALSADRAARWAHDPPPMRIRRYSIEDQYMAEGLWHIRARNDAWQRAPETAWRENLILERYFAPVLDTPSYAAAGVSRWPVEQRRDAETQSRGGAEQGRGAEKTRFRSIANPLEIHTFSPLLLWSCVFGLFLALALWSVRDQEPVVRSR